jgi:hypothetical protein
MAILDAAEFTNLRGIRDDRVSLTLATADNIT